MNHKKNKSISIICVVIMIGLICCGLFVSNGNELIKEMWTSLTSKTSVGIDKTSVISPQQMQEDPIIEPEQLQWEKPDPEPVPEPDIEQKPSPHVICVNQQLVIPVSGGSAAVESKVIDAGTKSSSSKQIALTFDAGWLYDQTLNLLEVLDEYQVKSTFFLRGQWVKDHPDLAKEILARGHSIENHSLTHSHMKDMTNSEVINEMITSTNIFKEITGYRPYLFRPPFGEYDSRILKILAEHGYPYTVKWTIDSLDWAEELNGVKITEQYLIDRILSNASSNGIVLMHVGGYQTVNALPEIIEGLQKDGYKLIKVNDMLPVPSTSKDEMIYTVKQGDTLTSIAKNYGITVDEIINANQTK